jgi:hypothetical protein
MIIDGDVAINLMLYYIFKKLGRVDNELMKTNLTLNGVGGGQPDGGPGCLLAVLKPNRIICKRTDAIVAAFT